MTDVLTPDQFQRECRALIQSVGYLSHEYTYAHSMAFSQQITEVAHVASGASNPTESEAKAHQALRGKLRLACELVSNARLGDGRTDGFYGVDPQTDELRSAMAKAEHEHYREEYGWDPVKNPPLNALDGSDMPKLKEAQERRRSRGEWGA